MLLCSSTEDLQHGKSCPPETESANTDRYFSKDGSPFLIKTAEVEDGLRKEPVTPSASFCCEYLEYLHRPREIALFRSPGCNPLHVNSHQPQNGALSFPDTLKTLLSDFLAHEYQITCPNTPFPKIIQSGPKRNSPSAVQNPCEASPT